MTDLQLPFRRTNLAPRPMSTMVSDSWRLATGDLRALAVPIALWWLLIFAAALVGPPVAAGERPQEFLYFMSRHLEGFALSVGHALLAGLLVLQHPIHLATSWRTQPWHRVALPAAKLVGFCVFVWLPIAAAEIAYLFLRGGEPAIGFGSPSWYLYETFHICWFPGLFGLAIASLCKDLPRFLVSSLVAIAAFPFLRPWVIQVTPESNWRLLGGALQPGIVWIALCCWLCFVVAYLKASRTWAAAIGFGLLIGGWYPVHEMEMRWTQTEPMIAAPNPAVRLVSTRPIQRPDHSQHDRSQRSKMRLCALVTIEGVPDGEFGTLRARGSFQSDELELVNYDYIWSSGWSDGTYDGRVSFLDLPIETLQQHRETRGTAKLEMKVRTGRTRVVEDGPVTVGQRILNREVAAIEVDQQAKKISIFMNEDRSSHLGRDPAVSISWSLARDGIPPGFGSGGESGSSQVGPNMGPPFPPGPSDHLFRWRLLGITTHRETTRHLVDGRWIRRPLDEGVANADMDQIAKDLRWNVTETTTTSEQVFQAELKDVALGDLTCN